MPGGDGTGPLGLGSMTGRRAGFCVGFNMPGFTNSTGGRGFFGRGRGIGLGRGRGFRNRFYNNTMYGGMSPNINYNPAISKEEEMNILKNQAKFMQDEINTINDRINELEKETS